MMVGTDLGGVVDVARLEMKEEVAVEEAQKIVVRLPVAVAELVAGGVVVEDVAMVEEAGKGKKVAVVAEEKEGGVGSREEDWTVVRRRVRERDRKVFEEREAVRKRMNVWRPARGVVPNELLGPRGMRSLRVVDSGYGSLGPSRTYDRKEVKQEGVERVGGLVAPMGQPCAPRGPSAYRGVVLGSERRRVFSGLGRAPAGRGRIVEGEGDVWRASYRGQREGTFCVPFYRDGGGFNFVLGLALACLPVNLQNTTKSNPNQNQQQQHHDHGNQRSVTHNGSHTPAPRPKITDTPANHTPYPRKNRY
ncbi:hypothetical protein C7212DRAFT_366841 [Tuber magnatum]|uniref:Uncharacterized protein n=1 Tax=Tuber magnatum TaxID=42249 RepID=A0A317SC52_9PEZI|nr:hypothetical protein C7212DRAFT_366841 [Tuber magnatum]